MSSMRSIHICIYFKKIIDIWIKANKTLFNYKILDNFQRPRQEILLVNVIVADKIYETCPIQTYMIYGKTIMLNFSSSNQMDFKDL